MPNSLWKQFPKTTLYFYWHINNAQSAYLNIQTNFMQHTYTYNIYLCDGILFHISTKISFNFCKPLYYTYNVPIHKYMYNCIYTRRKLLCKSLHKFYFDFHILKLCTEHIYKLKPVWGYLYFGVHIQNIHYIPTYGRIVSLKLKTFCQICS